MKSMKAPAKNQYLNYSATTKTTIINYYLVFTKATDIHFRERWLAPVARDIHDY